MAAGRAGGVTGRIPRPQAGSGFRSFSPLQNIFLIVALIGGGLGGYAIFNQIYNSQKSTATPVTPIAAAVTTIRSTVSATGSINATQQSSLSFQESGRVTAVYIKPGDTVQAGQKIAQLDTAALQIARDNAQSQLVSAQAKLDALNAPPTQDVVTAAEQGVASAQSQLTAAQNAVISDNNAISSANDDLATAQDGVSTASNTAQAAQNSIVDANSGVTTAQANLTKAQDTLAALEAGPLPTDVETVQANLDKAKADLQTAQTNYNNLINHSSVATAPETAALATAKQNYQTALATYQAKTAPSNSAAVSQAQTNLTLAQNDLQTTELKNLQVQSDPTASIADKQASQGQVASAQAAVDTAQANVQALQQGTDQQDLASAQSQLDSARTALQAAQQNYNNLISLSNLATRPETTALAAAQQEYNTALAAYQAKLAPPLQTDVSTDQAAIDSAQAGITSAQVTAQNAGITAANDQTAIGSAQSAAGKAAMAVNSAQVTAANAQANVPSVQSSLQAAQAKLSQTLAGPLPTDVVQAQQAVTQAHLALKQAQLNLDNATLTAPYGGVITAVNVQVGDQSSGAGSGTGSGGTGIATLVNPNAIEVDASVDETSVTQLKPGQPAIVTFDAIPGRAFPGTLSVVTPSGSTTNGVVSFPIVVTINNQGQTLPAGISANITIITSTTPNVLAVPSRDVVRQGQNQIVNVQVNGKRETRVVSTGVTNGTLTQITSGLKAGDLVLPPVQTQAQSAAGGTFGASGSVGGRGPVVVRGG